MNIDKGKEEFYKSVSDYLDKSYVILKLISEYFGKIKRECNKRFLIIATENCTYKKSNVLMSNNNIDRIEVFLQNSYKEDIFNNIYKVDFMDSAFLFKMFDFGKGDIILAGYELEDSVSTRSFLASLNEYKIQEKYERILNIV